ncbi:hypothetical protein Bca4012_036493 [Brassica carinata]
MTPPPTDLVEQFHDEIDEETPPPAVVPPAASGPLTVVAASVVNTAEEAGDNEIDEGAVDEHEIDEEEGDDDSVKGPTFVRSLGAWSKPLQITPPPTPPEPATPRFEVTEMLQSQIDSFWPSIGEAINGPKKKGQVMFPKKSVMQMPVDKIPPPALKEDGSLRFPWAARMNQSSRNLFRATEPTYRLDGTPQVAIPSKVLKLGPVNKKEYVLGQYHRCSSPPGGLIHVVLNRLWGRECRITCRKLGDSCFCSIFLMKILVNGLSSEVCGMLMIVSSLCLLGIRLGISHIASGLGEPMLTHKPRLDPANMGEAKNLVEVELDKPFPKLIALDDKQDNIYLVEVEYSWIPSACDRCGALGHKEKRCLLSPKPHDAAPITAELRVTNEEIPVMDIVYLAQNSFNTLVENLKPSSGSPLPNKHLRFQKSL